MGQAPVESRGRRPAVRNPQRHITRPARREVLVDVAEELPRSFDGADLAGLGPGDPRGASGGADPGRPLPPGARRHYGARLRASRAPAHDRPAPTQRGRRSGQSTWDPEFFRVRRLLAKARERPSERERRRLCEPFAVVPVIGEAWALKEGFRAIYRAADRAEAEVRLDHFLGAVERAALPAFSSFAVGVRAWREELLAYFDEPTTNGYAEGVFNK